MFNGLIFLWLLLANLPEANTDESRRPKAAPDVIELRHCAIEYERDSTLGAFVLIQAGGRIQESYVRPGDRVKAGQVIGRIHDKDAKAEVEFRRAQAESDIEVRVCEAKYALSLTKLKRAEVLYQRGVITPEELQLQQVEAKAAELDVEQARRNRTMAEYQRRRAEAELHTREFVSPHDGIVVEVYKDVGESVTVNEAVYRVVSVDRLRVIGSLDIQDAWRVRKGWRVRVIPDVAGVELPIEHRHFPGRVVFVDSLIDPKTRTCKIIAEVDNRDLLLRSGLEAWMEIFPDDAPSAGEDGPGVSTLGDSPVPGPSSPEGAPGSTAEGQRPTPAVKERR